jgi:hypothetical protein
VSKNESAPLIGFQPVDLEILVWRDRIYGSDERWLKLTNQQRDCLNYIDSSTRRIVLGWPRTGKTLLAVETGKRAARRRMAFAERFFRYAEACPAPPPLKHWRSIVALAFNIVVQRKILMKTERKDIFRVSARTPK